MAEYSYEMVGFSASGRENTARALELGFQRAHHLGLKKALVATNKGGTALQAAALMRDVSLIAVTHVTGYTDPNVQEMSPETRAELEGMGVKVLTAQHSFGGVNRAVRKALGSYQLDEIIANVLRIWGQGLKVCIEMSLMAADAGLVRTDEPVLCVAGTGRGADTAAILLPSNAHTFFDVRVLEVVCYPVPRHPAFHKS